ncbi:MAG TPA: hypothetical protein PKE68_12375, partial [Saprospiraceae bacterium]|nr:hypothetical protein [Saprospiraceae bacterium]
MKNYMFLTLLTLLMLSGNLMAQQYDDLYYDPAKDRGFFYGYQSDKRSNNATNSQRNVYSYTDNNAYRENDYRRNNEDFYDDDYYSYEDDYDFYYTSRIRRFHRPYYGFSYFDPIYVDMFYYDPFFQPGATVLIYDSFFSPFGWNRWNRWNRWNVGIGFGPAWGWNAWGNPWGGWNSWNRWNRWGAWDPWWGMNSWYGPGVVNNYFFGGGFGGGFYCPPTWGSGYVYNTVNDIRNNPVVYGPRTTGTTRTPRLNDREIRREAPRNVTNTPRQTTDGVNIPGSTGRVSPVNPATPEREVGGRDRAHTERQDINRDDNRRAAP